MLKIENCLKSEYKKKRKNRSILYFKCEKCPNIFKCRRKDLKIRSEFCKECRYSYVINSGDKYNRLTAIKFAYKKNSQNLWWFECDCGNVVARRPIVVKNHNTKSCGCHKLNHLKKEYGMSSKKSLFARYKKRAARKLYKFELTFDEFCTITSKNCYYCGNIPQNKFNKKDLYGEYIYSGIDRKDNNLGYTLQNSVPCCHICNFAKYRMTEKEFLDWGINLAKILIKKGVVRGV